jgi:hypothetical protein
VFSELYGSDFIYQNYALGDSDIRNNNYKWHGWLMTKGRKYSDKTIKYVDGLMGKFDSSRRHLKDTTAKTAQCLVRLESQNEVTALCYFSYGEETFRQIFNSKTCKMENFTWKQDKWQKANKLPSYVGINSMCISESYCGYNPYDYKYLLEAKRYYEGDELSKKRYWYSPAHNLYCFIFNYMSKPVIHQILQISNEESRKNVYLSRGKIEPVYGNVPNKGRTMFKKLGVSKYQFNNPNGIPYTKSVLKTNDISHIDDETWLQCTQVFKDLTSLDSNDTYILDFLNNHNEFSLHRWIKINKLANQHIEPSRYHYYRRDPVKQLYKDYYMSLNTINEFGTDISSFPLFFNDMKQLQRYHDDAARIVSSIRNKGNDEKFQSLYNQRQKMLENDGQYLIDMPKCCADLTEEGSYLHHCVGGYANSVANGNTAIYFLRKASEPNTPWLTVEVQNKRCRQIHGSCNAWMGSKDEYFDAVPFLHYWFTKHKIVYDEHLLTNKATGYSSCGSNRDMPWEEIYAYSQSKKLKKSS